MSKSGNNFEKCYSAVKTDNIKKEKKKPIYYDDAHFTIPRNVKLRWLKKKKKMAFLFLCEIIRTRTKDYYFLMSEKIFTTV